MSANLQQWSILLLDMIQSLDLFVAGTILFVIKVGVDKIDWATLQNSKYVLSDLWKSFRCILPKIWFYELIMNMF